MINANYKDLICRFLNKRGLKFETHDTKDRCRFKLGFSGLKGAYERLQVLILLDENVVQSVVYLQSQIMPAASFRVMELLTRLNYNLKIGKFEYNIDSGEVKFQIGQHVFILDGPNANGAIESMLYQALFMADSASRGIEDAIKGSYSSKEIFNRIVGE